MAIFAPIVPLFVPIGTLPTRRMQVPVQKCAGYRHFTPIIAGSGPGNGPVPAVDGPKTGHQPQNRLFLRLMVQKTGHQPQNRLFLRLMVQKMGHQPQKGRLLQLMVQKTGHQPQKRRLLQLMVQKMGHQPQKRLFLRLMVQKMGHQPQKRRLLQLMVPKMGHQPQKGRLLQLMVQKTGHQPHCKVTIGCKNGQIRTAGGWERRAVVQKRAKTRYWRDGIGAKGGGGFGKLGRKG